MALYIWLDYYAPLKNNGNGGHPFYVGGICSSMLWT